MPEYFDEKDDRLYIPSVKEIIHKAREQFIATLELPQAKKPKMLYPKEDKSPLQVIHEVLKGE